jgi:hypothetical protein
MPQTPIQWAQYAVPAAIEHVHVNFCRTWMCHCRERMDAQERPWWQHP